MKKYIERYEEQLVYLICGISTTIINYIFFTVFIELFRIPLVISNVLAFVLAATFAYFTNKYFVFKQRNFALMIMVKEYLSFMSLRVISMLLETTILYFFVEMLMFNKYLIKVVASVLVVILNYIFGKYITFKKGVLR